MDEQTVTISRRGADRLAKGHPWIYRSDVEAAPATLEGGDVVVLKDGRGRFLAKAFWSALSKIARRGDGAARARLPGRALRPHRARRGRPHAGARRRPLRRRRRRADARARDR